MGVIIIKKVSVFGTRMCQKPDILKPLSSLMYQGLKWLLVEFLFNLYNYTTREFSKKTSFFSNFGGVIRCREERRGRKEKTNKDVKTHFPHKCFESGIREKHDPFVKKVCGVTEF
jgi:hypothetical protein